MNIHAPYTCKFCGTPSWRAPSEQELPPSYCHEEDHRNPSDCDVEDEEQQP